MMERAKELIGKLEKLGAGARIREVLTGGGETCRLEERGSGASAGASALYRKAPPVFPRSSLCVPLL